MAISDERVYSVNGMAVSAMELIDLARRENTVYDTSGFYQTSVAADILRKKGFTVTDLRDPKFVTS